MTDAIILQFPPKKARRKLDISIDVMLNLIIREGDPDNPYKITSSEWLDILNAELTAKGIHVADQIAKMKREL